MQKGVLKEDFSFVQMVEKIWGTVKALNPDNILYDLDLTMMENIKKVIPIQEDSDLMDEITLLIRFIEVNGS